MAAPRIAVVGAGIVGVTVALRLAQRGAAVTLVEAEAPGSGTTGSTFAWIDASHPSLEPYLELNVDAMAAWRELGAELGDPPWLALTGTLIWETDPDAAAALERHAGLLQALGHPVHRVGAGEVAALEPDLVLGDIQSAWHLPTEGHVQPLPALGDLLAAGRDAGLTLRERTRVVRPVTTGGRITGLELEGGELLAADLVVSCVGRFTERFLAPAGVDVPMIDGDAPQSPAVGLLVLTTPVPSRVRGVVVADGLMLRPDGAGRLLLHSDAADILVRATTPVMPPPAVAGELVEQVRGRLRHAGAAQVQAARIGIRALPADRLPVVGWAHPGLYVVATHSGVTLAPLLGRLVAQEILDQRQPAALSRFAPARFQEAA